MDGGDRRLCLRLSIELGSEPISGWLIDESGQRRFSGWLDLASALERLLEQAASERPEASPAQASEHEREG